MDLFGFLVRLLIMSPLSLSSESIFFFVRLIFVARIVQASIHFERESRDLVEMEDKSSSPLKECIVYVTKMVNHESTVVNLSPDEIKSKLIPMTLSFLRRTIVSKRIHFQKKTSAKFRRSFLLKMDSFGITLVDSSSRAWCGPKFHVFSRSRTSWWFFFSLCITSHSWARHSLFRCEFNVLCENMVWSKHFGSAPPWSSDADQVIRASRHISRVDSEVYGCKM